MARVLGHPIALRSGPDKGSVFTVTAPIARAAAAVPAPRRPAAAATRQSPLAGMVVVAIDNDERSWTACARCWRPGAACRSSRGSQREALAELARQKRVPDAILADYHLDEGDGVDAVVALRWRFGASIPAALITADRSDEMRARAMDKDVMVLNKPLKPAALRAVLAQWRAAAPADAPD